MFCKNVVLHGHFVTCVCPCLVRIDVASVKRYLNAIKAKQSALNARKPLVGGRDSSFSPSISLEPVVYWGVYAGIRRIPTSGFFLTAYTHLSDDK